MGVDSLSWDADLLITQSQKDKVHEILLERQSLEESPRPEALNALTQLPSEQIPNPKAPNSLP